MSLCGFLCVPINRHFGHGVACKCGHSVFGSLVRDVVQNEVVGTALGASVHTWEMRMTVLGGCRVSETHPTLMGLHRCMGWGLG